MAWELTYESYFKHIPSNQLDETIEENTEYKRQIENEILGLIMMDPSKVRNKPKSSKNKDAFDDDDDAWMNNVQYLTRCWKDLKEQWENANATILRCNEAKDAIARDHREVEICPDCLIELQFENREIEKTAECYSRFEQVLACPKCRKVYATNGEIYAAEQGVAELTKPKPMIVTIKTWGEG